MLVRLRIKIDSQLSEHAQMLSKNLSGVFFCNDYAEFILYEEFVLETFQFETPRKTFKIFVFLWLSRGSVLAFKGFRISITEKIVARLIPEFKFTSHFSSLFENVKRDDFSGELLLDPFC